MLRLSLESEHIYTKTKISAAHFQFFSVFRNEFQFNGLQIAELISIFRLRLLIHCRWLSWLSFQFNRTWLTLSIASLTMAVSVRDCEWLSVQEFICGKSQMKERDGETFTISFPLNSMNEKWGDSIVSFAVSSLYFSVLSIHLRSWREQLEWCDETSHE